MCKKCLASQAASQGRSPAKKMRLLISKIFRLRVNVGVMFLPKTIESTKLNTIGPRFCDAGGLSGNFETLILRPDSESA